MSKSIVLLESSIALINEYNTSNVNKLESTYKLIIDFIALKKKHKLSTTKLYEMYIDAGLNVHLTESSVKNRLKWNLGTIDELKTIGVANFNDFCGKKDGNFGTDEYKIHLAEKKAAKVKEAAKKKQDKEVDEKTNIQLREQNSLLFQSFKTSEKELFENLNKKDSNDLEQIKVFIDIMIKNKSLETVKEFNKVA